jgi:PIN domain nuclease of toxin-antitoxin system
MILLDTHALIWLLLAPEKLSAKAREAILDARLAREQISCSQISLYEIANATRRRRVLLKTTIEDFIVAAEAKIHFTPVTAEIAVCAGEIPEPFHGDPMDRIITATALLGDYTLLTNDNRIRKSGLCRVIW